MKSDLKGSEWEIKFAFKNAQVLNVNHWKIKHIYNGDKIITLTRKFKSLRQARSQNSGKV